MTSVALRSAKNKNTRDSDACVLLIEAEADDAEVILDQLRSVTEEPFQVEWVTRLPSAIERLPTFAGIE